MPLINVRVTEQEKERFKLACSKIGLTMTEVFKEAMRSTISKSRGASSYAEGEDMRG